MARTVISAASPSPPSPSSPSSPWSAEASFRELARIQIHEPLKEAKIKATIPVASPIDDAISRAVQSQYEENPYPRWSTIGQVSLPAEVIAAGKGKSVLVAGCGTGREAVEAGFIFPAARVDALDLSRTSLAYGIRQARELKAGNVFFMPKLEVVLMLLAHGRQQFVVRILQFVRMIDHRDVGVGAGL